MNTPSKGSSRAAFLLIMILLSLPGILTSIIRYQQSGAYHASRQLLVSALFFIIPMVFFYRNIRIYLLLLLPLALMTPVFVFSIYSFRLPPGYSLISFILQTNMREALEASRPFLHVLIPFTSIYIGLYLFGIYKITYSRGSLGWLAGFSFASLVILSLLIYYENRLFDKNLKGLSTSNLLIINDYPFSIVSGIKKALDTFEKCDQSQSADFSFNARKKDTLDVREIYALIIGESSRYDRWQINGYHRNTSPRLRARKELISFSNVITGAFTTALAVPQIITRANPDALDQQYQEKSILGAFQEAGFKTVWLSNQSDKEILTSASIIMHAKTADIAMFSPSYSPNVDFGNMYDGRLLPILDSILTTNHGDLFFVLHTYGNHWDYGRRYPPEFDVFLPSRQSESPERQSGVQAILNAYDNSILYTDFFIDRVIGLIEKQSAISAVFFISDHGEDLFNVFPDKLNFHFRPSVFTLKVPLFAWTSPEYRQVFPERCLSLEKNKSTKAGTENMFYTLLDMANITFPGFDSVKSLANPGFIPSEQKFYDPNVGHARLFSEVYVE